MARVASCSGLRPILAAALSLWTLFLFVAPAQAYQEYLDRSRLSSCAGMYQKSAIINGKDAAIELTFETAGEKLVGNFTSLIYNRMDVSNFEDRSNLYACTEEGIELKLCTQEEYGHFFLKKDAQNISDIRWQPILESATFPVVIKYPINLTGFYCVVLEPISRGAKNFTALVEWRNPYGEIPAFEYSKLPFYGLLSIVYLALGVAWMIKSSFHWRDLLPVQHYISGVMFFLMIEMSFNYGYWSNYNTTGTMSYGLLALVVILNAARNSMSFFMLLIVALGYGVVRPTLGTTMSKCLALAYTHFFFDVLYASGTMLTSPEEGGIFVLIFVLPLAMTMTAFYTWTFQALQDTIQKLELRKQSVKLLMYKRLWRLLAFSVMLVFLFFIINSIYFAHHTDEEWVDRNWQYRWFLVDGWLNILYLFVFVTLCFLWRPTNNNQRYGLVELATDEEAADQADLESRGGVSTGTNGQSIKLREQPRSAGGRHSSDAARDRDIPEDSIFDIGDAADEWLEEHDNEESGSLQKRSASPGRRSPTRASNEERRHLTREASKLN